MSSILKMPLSIHVPSQTLSFSKSLLSSTPFFLHTELSTLSLHNPTRPPDTIIRMGGGPRTFPGGVSKWQWKRMQAKKAKQLLQARLARERQIYEMRKRAELKAAVSELERPWEAVEKAPNLFSVSADEQVKVLADRFQKPGGFDMWSERDGPQLFDAVDDLPSARFFPKGVVHSVKPYLGSREIDENAKLLSENKEQERQSEDNPDGKKNGVKWSRKGNRRRFGPIAEGNSDGKMSNLKPGAHDKRRTLNSENFDKRSVSKSEVYDKRRTSKSENFDKRSVSKSEVYDKRRTSKSENFDKRSVSKSEVYDMRLQRDGSYGIDRKK